MEFSSKNVETKANKTFAPSAYLGYGVHELKINNMEIEHAKTTGSPRVVFSMEGRPVKDPNFQGLEGCKGQVARVRSTFMKTEEQQREFVEKLTAMAEAMGVRSELDKIESNNIEDYVKQATGVLCGNWARFCVATEQYLTTEGKTKDSFVFPRFNFVESIDTKESKLKFDKNATYHFRPAVKPDSDTVGTAVSADAAEDLPF